MSAKTGLGCKLYHNSATWESPTWGEVDLVKDVTLNLEKGEADVTTRANGGWRAYVGTLKDGSVEFEMLWDPADTAFAAIRDAYLDNTPVEMAVMDGEITENGSEGLHAEFEVTQFNRNEPLEEGVTANVTLKPAHSENNPEWLTVSGS